MLYKGIFRYLCQFKVISLAFLNTVWHYQEYPWTLSHNIVGHSLVWSFVGYVWSFQTESIEIDLYFSTLFQNLSNHSDVLIWNLQILVLVLNNNNQLLLNYFLLWVIFILWYSIWTSAENLWSHIYIALFNHWCFIFLL